MHFAPPVLHDTSSSSSSFCKRSQRRWLSLCIPAISISISLHQFGVVSQPWLAPLADMQIHAQLLLEPRERAMDRPNTHTHAHTRGGDWMRTTGDPTAVTKGRTSKYEGPSSLLRHQKLKSYRTSNKEHRSNPESVQNNKFWLPFFQIPPSDTERDQTFFLLYQVYPFLRHLFSPLFMPCHNFGVVGSIYRRTYTVRPTAFGLDMCV